MFKPTRIRSALTHRAAAAGALSAGAVAALGLGVPGTAAASHRQVPMIQDDGQLLSNPSATLAQMRALGARTVRLEVFWNNIAPHPTSARKPKFNAADPNAYRAGGWAPYDAVVRDAAADGITVDLVVAQGAPRWAEGSHIPSNYVIGHNPGAKYFAWKPSAKDYGQFLRAMATRYDGKFTPAGQGSALPRVHFWTLWNEPNFGEDLGPQATDTSRISYAPMLYRNLVRSGYSALAGTGHRHDTIVIGEFAAHGSSLSMGRHGRTWPQGLPGNAGQTQPIPFVRTLYCLNARGNKLGGRAARQVGCPTTAKGRANFRKNNPGLFNASGVGDHPYANNATPRSDGKANPNWATLPNLPKLERALDRGTSAWGSHKRYSIYNDEYGYITDPPQTNKAHSVPVQTAAKYINWAEYITYNEPRVASYDQYLLEDGAPNAETGNGGFATGLYTSNGKPKATVNAFRLPLWLPSTTLRRPGRDKVWGEARPASWEGKSTKRKQTVEIQFQAHGKGAWKTIDKVKSDGYFLVRPKFKESGDVRLRYTYPSATSDPLLPLGDAGHTIVSRTQPIVVR
jgi:hypothetical protein